MKRAVFQSYLPFLSLGALLISACSSPEKMGTSPAPAVMDQQATTPEERFSAAIDRRISLGLGVGLAAVIRDNGKSTVFVRGRKSIEPPAALLQTDSLSIGIASQTVTGILVHLAVNEGKLKLSTTLEEVLPALRGKDAGKIKIESLALHCSGLVPVDRASDADEKGPIEKKTEKKLMAALSEWRAPAVAPDCAAAKRAAPDEDYATLGLVLEKVYRRSFSDLLRSRFAQGLKITGIEIERNGKTRKKRNITKTFSSYDAAGDLVESLHFPGVYAASGGVKMTPRAMREFVEALEKPPFSTIGRAVEAALVSGTGWDFSASASLRAKNGQKDGITVSLFLDRAKKKAAFIVSNQGISVEGLGLFGIGALPKDDLIAAIEKGRAPAPQEEVTRLKGHYQFHRLLDDDQDAIEASKLPQGEIASLPSAIEIVESSNHLAARIGTSPERVGAYLFSGPKKGEWNLLDGGIPFRQLEIEGGEDGDASEIRLRTSLVGSSGKTYWLEYRKLEMKPENYPAYEN